MESPPRPKRILLSKDNLPVFTVAPPFIADSDCLSSEVTANRLLSCPKHCLQSLSSIPTSSDSSDIEKPNLCAFVNEVVTQKEKQEDHLKTRKHLQLIKKQQLNTLKCLNSNLFEKRKSIKRKSFLALEDANRHQNQIKILRDEILNLLLEDSHLEKQFKNVQLKSISAVAHSQRAKMCEYEEKVRKSNLNSAICNEVVNIKSGISVMIDETNVILKNLSSTNSAKELYLQKQLEDKKMQKENLIKIFERKKQAIIAEDKNLENLQLELETTKKRIAAQKLRLRSRITEKRRRVQQFEEEAAALQIEIDDLGDGLFN